MIKKIVLHANEDSGAPSNIPGVLARPDAMIVDVGNPPRSKVERTQEGKKRLKEKDECGTCKLTGHNATRSP